MPFSRADGHPLSAWPEGRRHDRDEGGINLEPTPVSDLRTKDPVEVCLDPAWPEFAIVGAWLGCRGHGPKAQRIAIRALELTDKLPAPLREAHTRAILARLNPRLLASLKKMLMDVDKVPETKALRVFRLWFQMRCRVNGMREALLIVLTARGLSPTEEERTSIATLTDLAALNRCIRTAVTAASVGAVLASADTSHRRRAAPVRAPRPRALKNRSRRR